MLPSSSSVTFPSFTRTFSSHSKKHKLFSSSSKKPSSSFICLRIGVEEIAEIAHNKVLVAAAVASAIGQFSKPFTSSILYRRAVNFKAVIQAGGMPSTHSAGVVAVATSLGLESLCNVRCSGGEKGSGLPCKDTQQNDRKEARKGNSHTGKR
ncbi:uncharacterized protein LOC131240874 isoform X3 [Magnolia sinica]|uniref:uncharacterized protein LOC131240874 isoform X3 n=1 Tax=Magnolia sinica TaxID=86752 RepID=UPI0026597929|nr:uncharacterized protein LOC131240874 isoform X3 [Magnolia sinica]